MQEITDKLPDWAIRLLWPAAWLRRKHAGYFNYYGVIGNSRMLSQYWFESRRIAFASLNRRSQRLSYSWAGFIQMWQTLGIGGPRIEEKPRANRPHLAFSQA
ncbi:hypothetical protein [Pelagicoccus sp. SDUM812005]|uniref:hypothetical protein n=1 Tax=Pelagicoccus sp. SDUM812005 TaxID=3041257 RepID=UPI00280CBF2B|nr:hypothetical protein [Pelagicoccus sp. SDUM812005]MDQ8182714.1 hypothetical protein [Pelagicoccus sp. SDUM812005]